LSSEGIDYQTFVHDALRDAVRRLLAQVAEQGLPGDHYFYIGFQTGHPGVAMPRVLRDLYPEEMTVILQHQYWNLEVDPDHFSVELSFSASRHRLTIPFAALTTFADPSAEFAWRFLPRPPRPARPPENWDPYADPNPPPEAPSPHVSSPPALQAGQRFKPEAAEPPALALAPLAAATPPTPPVPKEGARGRPGEVIRFDPSRRK
jgi:hypothetical protein